VKTGEAQNQTAGAASAPVVATGAGCGARMQRLAAGRGGSVPPLVPTCDRGARMNDRVRNKKCHNPLCDRLVLPSVAYCCGACGDAHEGRYEIHPSGPLGHSDECNARGRGVTTGEEPPDT